MEENKIDNPPAFACVSGKSNEEGSFLQEGMSLRDYFANSAPIEIPSWFKHVKKKSPEEPTSWTEYRNHPGQGHMKTWHHDPSFNLPKELSFYQNAWESYWELLEDFKREDEETRFFQWRFYYADAMLKARQTTNKE